MRSKTIPDFKAAMDGISRDMEKLDARVRQKLELSWGSDNVREAKTPELKWSSEEEELASDWRRGARNLTDAWTSEEIKTLKERWSH